MLRRRILRVAIVALLPLLFAVPAGLLIWRISTGDPGRALITYCTTTAKGADVCDGSWTVTAGPRAGLHGSGTIDDASASDEDTTIDVSVYGDDARAKTYGTPALLLGFALGATALGVLGPYQARRRAARMAAQATRRTTRP